MQDKYKSENLNVVLLSTDSTQALYDSRAEQLFKKYGGGNWPSILIPGGFDGAVIFGDFGYGKLVVDRDGIVRAAGFVNLQQVLAEMFEK